MKSSTTRVEVLPTPKSTETNIATPETWDGLEDFLGGFWLSFRCENVMLVFQGVLFSPEN